MTLPSGAPLHIAGLPNLRDIGGWPTGDGGRVRRGMLYRSVQVANLDDDGATAFAALGLRTVFDLRTGAERAAQPDVLPQGTTHVVVDVLADAMGEFGAQALQDLATDPARLVPMLADGAGARQLAESYRQIVGSESGLAAYRRLYTDLADPQARPALIHCTTGKDRTGWGTAVLLTLLGVSDDDVMRDYLLTNDELLPALAPIFDRVAAAGADPELLRPVLGVRREYLETGFDEMTSRFGDVEGYFRSGLGLDEATVAALKDAFVEPAAPSSMRHEAQLRDGTETDGGERHSCRSQGQPAHHRTDRSRFAAGLAHRRR